MTKGVSIVLCTYNGKSRLVKTFEHLCSQQVSIPCELIFVDNASTDGTKEFAEEWWSNKGVDTIEFRSFSQSIPGKSYAQDLGYEMAKYEYLLVCDDDNWLKKNYVQTAYDIMENDHNIGALGGWCEAVFEAVKPIWFDKYANYFAVAKQGKQSGDISNKKGCLFGAGMVIRKSHWLELKHQGFKHLLSCRKGNSLSSGGDTEYSYALRLLGYKIWYDERLYFKHYMTKNKLNIKYLSRLRKAMAYSNFILWPYQDLLNSSTRSRNDFYKEAIKKVPILPIKKIAALAIGNFAKKENAKTYFRNFKYRLLDYEVYKLNLDFIKSWSQVKQ